MQTVMSGADSSQGACGWAAPPTTGVASSPRAPTGEGSRPPERLSAIQACRPCWRSTTSPSRLPGAPSTTRRRSCS